MSLTHEESFELEMLLHDFHESVLRKDDPIKLMNKKRSLVERIRELKEEPEEKTYVVKNNGKYLNSLQLESHNAKESFQTGVIKVGYAADVKGAQRITEKQKQDIEQWLTFEFEEDIE